VSCPGQDALAAKGITRKAENVAEIMRKTAARRLHQTKPSTSSSLEFLRLRPTWRTVVDDGSARPPLPAVTKLVFTKNLANRARKRQALQSVLRKQSLMARLIIPSARMIPWPAVAVRQLVTAHPRNVDPGNVPLAVFDH